jgi:hypothetical protein
MHSEAPVMHSEAPVMHSEAPVMHSEAPVMPVLFAAAPLAMDFHQFPG